LIEAINFVYTSVGPKGFYFLGGLLFGNVLLALVYLGLVKGARWCTPASVFLGATTLLANFFFSLNGIGTAEFGFASLGLGLLLGFPLMVYANIASFPVLISWTRQRKKALTRLENYQLFIAGTTLLFLFSYTGLFLYIVLKRMQEVSEGTIQVY